MFFNDYELYFPANFCLRSERLIIRRVRKSDADDLYEYYSKPESCRFSQWTAHRSKFETRSCVDYIISKYRKRIGHVFAIEIKSSGKVIGTISLTEFTDDYRLVEIGYGINSCFWRQGYGSEAVSLFVEFIFGTLGSERISAKVLRENVASAALLRHCGFVSEGVLRKGILFKGEAKDLEIFSVLREEYQQK